MQSTEQWLPVPEYEGMYEVSDRGTVRSLTRVDAAGRHWKGRILKQKVRRGAVPYRMVNLWRDGRGHMAYVHRLVAEAFIGQAPFGDAQICHNDGNPSHNNVGNLRWGTASDNAWDRVHQGTHFQSSKTRCKRGHALFDANVRRVTGGYRQCRACGRERANAFHAGRPFSLALSDERFRDITGHMPDREE